jgi:hypothetical protein
MQSVFFFAEASIDGGTFVFYPIADYRPMVYLCIVTKEYGQKSAYEEIHYHMPCRISPCGAIRLHKCR